MAATMPDHRKLADLLGPDGEALLSYTAKGVKKDMLHLPGADFVDRIMSATDRPLNVLRNFQLLLNTGRLGGTGYVSILPVDQGIEHSAGASFAPGDTETLDANGVKRHGQAYSVPR